MTVELATHQLGEETRRVGEAVRSGVICTPLGVELDVKYRTSFLGHSGKLNVIVKDPGTDEELQELMDRGRVITPRTAVLIYESGRVRVPYLREGISDAESEELARPASAEYYAFAALLLRILSTHLDSSKA
jgi:hypothetical protein